jgi:hypothetical protein
MLNDICIANKQNPLSMSSNMATVTELAHHLYETPKRTDYFAQARQRNCKYHLKAQLFKTLPLNFLILLYQLNLEIVKILTNFHGSAKNF